MRSFEAAARQGSFNRAAEELFVTPSAISHQIKVLEEFLGVPLFQREKRRVFLTTAGEKYLAAVEHALNEIDNATRRVLAAQNPGSVNISVAPAFLTRWLVPRIRDFQEKCPDVELRLSASTGEVDFLRTDTDMAIYFGQGEWEYAESHFLLGVILVPVCSPKLLNRHPLRSAEDLRHHTLLRVSTRRDEWNQMLDKAGIARASAGKRMSFSSTALALGAAIEGAGVALTDLSLVERELEYGQLIKPLDLKIDTGNAFYLVYQKGRQLSYGMRTFKDWILEALGQ